MRIWGGMRQMWVFFVLLESFFFWVKEKALLSPTHGFHCSNACVSCRMKFRLSYAFLFCKQMLVFWVICNKLVSLCGIQYSFMKLQNGFKVYNIIIGQIEVTLEFTIQRAYWDIQLGIIWWFWKLLWFCGRWSGKRSVSNWDLIFEIGIHLVCGTTIYC
jgi:hypothetical protein